MTNIQSVLESILFAAAKPIGFRELADFLKIKEDEVASAIKSLQAKYNIVSSGLHIAVNNQKAQMVTNPDYGQILKDYFQEEASGELTKPSLETLTIIAYRQPISKEELEQIRGVNCSLILRNLLIRGLIESHEDKSSLAPTYSVTMDFLRNLGISSVSELPDFEKLNSDANLQKILEANAENKEQN